MKQGKTSIRDWRAKEALAAADDHFKRIEASPEFAGVADVKIEAGRNPLLRLAFADGYLRGQDTMPWREYEDLKYEQRQSFERVTALRLALRDLLDAIGEEACSFDHHGYCQTHYISSPCEVAAARRVLEEDGAGTAA